MESIRRVMAGAFQGASRSKPPMMVEGVVRWGVQIPVAYLLSFWLAVGAGGVWWAVSGGQILSGALLLVMVFSVGEEWKYPGLGRRSGFEISA